MSRLSVWLIPFQPCFMCSVNVPCQNPGLVTSTYCRISRRRLWIGLCCGHSPAPWATNPWWHFLSCSPRPSSLPPPPVWARWSWKNPLFLRGGWGGWKKGLMSCYVSGIRFSGKRSKSPGKCCKSCFKFEGNNFKGNKVPGWLRNSAWTHRINDCMKFYAFNALLINHTGANISLLQKPPWKEVLQISMYSKHSDSCSICICNLYLSLSNKRSIMLCILCKYKLSLKS